jgi:hypothetical protein
MPALAALLAMLVASGCVSGREAATAKERPAHSITRFTERTELFVEFPTLVKGEESVRRAPDEATTRPSLPGAWRSSVLRRRRRAVQAAPQRWHLPPGRHRRRRVTGLIVVDAGGFSDRHQLVRWRSIDHRGRR